MKFDLAKLSSKQLNEVTERLNELQISIQKLTRFQKEAIVSTMTEWSERQGKVDVFEFMDLYESMISSTDHMFEAIMAISSRKD